MDEISFVGSKGGVGTSTVAILHALSVAEGGRRVRRTATAPAGVEVLAGRLAVPVPGPGEVVPVTPELTLGDAADPRRLHRRRWRHGHLLGLRWARVLGRAQRLPGAAAGSRGAADNGGCAGAGAGSIPRAA